MTLSPLTLVYRLIEPGAKLHLFDVLLLYGSVIWFWTVFETCGVWGEDIARMAVTNATLQVILFVMVVQIPCFVTGKMSYVDLAWPTGLVLLALQAYDGGTVPELPCWERRAFLVCFALGLHGARMAIGASVLFFPYNFPNGDLSRYQYAKKRWIRETSAEQLWWLKQQHDTMMQAYANSVVVAAPVLLVATNPNPGPIRPLEWIGFGSWLLFWGLENVADAQILRFRNQRKEKDTDTVVIGYPPYDGWQQCLWTKSRHPNYCCEWMCWNSFGIMALPSALDLLRIEGDGSIGSTVARIGIFAQLYCLSRVFYDCLLHWTGAEPAESQSVVKRGRLYQEYQRTTNVLFPVSIPFFNHHRAPGWPGTMGEKRV